MVGGHAQLVAIDRKLPLGAKQQAGVVHQHVEAGVAGIELGRGPAHQARSARSASSTSTRCVPGGGLDFLLRGGGFVGVAGQDHHMGAHFGQLGGRDFANAGSGAGDEDNLVGKVGHKRKCKLCL